MRLEEISVTFSRKSVLTNVSLKVEAEQCVALLGQSGSGKTTLLRVIAGFIKPDQGRVYLMGRDVTKLPPEYRSVSMLFQEPVLFPHLTVRENATVGFQKGKKNSAMEYAVRDFAKAFEIDGHLNRKLRSGLSGGEKQRAALLRTFTHAKEILLLDEPLKSALNVELRWKLLRTIRSHVKAKGRTTLVVTHDFEEAAYLADEIAVIDEKGQELHKGPTFKMYNDPPTLQVARILGKGTELDGPTFFKREKRETAYPFVFEGPEPRTVRDAHALFARPDKVSINPDGFGFKIKAISFLGDRSLVEIVPLESVEQSETQIFVSMDPQLANLLGKDQVVGAKLSTGGIIYFDKDGRRIPT